MRLQTIMAAACAALCLASCHTTRRAEEVRAEVATSTSVSLHQEQAMQHSGWWSDTQVQLDSFEILVPLDHVIDINNKVDTLAPGRTVYSDQDTRPACAVIRARRVRVASASCATHEAATHEQHVDSLKQLEAATSERQNEVDQVAVSKPPDLAWTIPIVILIIVSAYLFHKRYIK